MNRAIESPYIKHSTSVMKTRIYSYSACLQRNTCGTSEHRQTESMRLVRGSSSGELKKLPPFKCSYHTSPAVPHENKSQEEVSKTIKSIANTSFANTSIANTSIATPSTSLSRLFFHSAPIRRNGRSANNSTKEANEEIPKAKFSHQAVLAKNFICQRKGAHEVLLLLHELLSLLDRH